MKKLYTLLFIITSYCSFSQGYYGTPATGVTVIHYSEPIEETEINEISTFDAPITPFGTPTGSSLEVGTIEGTLNVSLSGAATYDIPIALPPGIGGNAPKISLSYNSQGGNGYAGYGWNISGISSITKTDPTKYHDNALSSDYIFDRHLLDGNRLILKNGTYDRPGAELETESFSNLKITTIGKSPYTVFSPESFKVEYPDGSYALYGNVANSNSRNEWAITHWQNTEGVRISYEYIKDEVNNTLKISKIKYGSRLETAALNEIEFIYTTRNRPEQAYLSGKLFSINTILSEIRVKGNGIGYRNYVLAYDITSLGYQRLTKITEKSGDNTKSYNPTVFTYTNTSDSMYYTSTPTTTIPGFSNIAITNSNTVTADFDGDGGMDFILYPTSGELKRKKYWVYTNLNAPSGPNIVEHQVDQFEALIPVTFLAGDATTGYKLKADPGWVIIQNSGTTLYVSICSSPFTPGTGINVQYGFSISLSELGGNGAKSYCSGDFNGDGMTDVICVDLTTGKFYFIDLDKRLSNHVTLGGTLNTMGTNDKLLVGDYNGDGKSDLLHFRNNNVRCWTHVGYGNFLSAETIFADDPSINPSLPIWLGDYNGDGKMDFIIPKAGPPYSTEYYKYTSGGGGKTTEQFFHYEPGNAFNTHHYIPSDVNNDGKTDLVWITTTVADGTEGSPGSLRTRFLINKNGNFSMTTGNYITSSSGTVAGINTFSVPLFMNPDKLNPRMEVAVMGGNKIHYFKSTKDFGQEKLLTSITNGNGIIETITYKPLIKCKTLGCLSDYIPDELVENYPNFDVTADPGHYIVTKLERKSSAATTKQLYRYLGAVTNVEGLGFLGFKSIFKTNWHQDNSQITSSVINFDIEKRGAVKSEYTFESFGEFYASSNPTIFLSKTLNTNASEILPNKVFKIKNTVKETFSGLDNTRYRETNTFDEYNNVTSTSFSFAKMTSGFALVSKSGSTTFTYENSPMGTTYYIGRPLTKNTSTTLSTGILGQLTTEEIYGYTNNLLTQTKTKGHNTNYITQDNVYDVYGNITKTTVTATGLVPRVSNFQYDPTGRFLTKATDGEGLATTYVINANNGSTTSITDPYGNVTQYFYDVWGKNIKTTDYLGKNTVSTFAVLPSGMAEVTTTGDDGSSAYSRFDDLGREFITGVKNIDNTWSYIKKEYDIYDRQVSISEPYSDPAGTPSQFSTTLYDAIGRITQTTDYTGKITNFTYSPLTSIVDDGTQTVTNILNAAGNIISRKDSGGTIKYSYDSRDNLIQTDLDGVKTLIAYNGWGQKTKLTDPSAGVYEYEYNDFGEVTKETTPKGYTNYTYDNFGKIKTKLRNDGSTGWSVTYNYDATTKLLSSVDRLGSSIIYTYDAKKRIIDIEDQSSATYKKTYTYDAFGRIDKENFATTYSGQTSSTKIRNTYKNGYHWQIYDDATNQILTQVNTVNARGQLATAQLGNGTDINNTYDTHGYIKRILHKKATTTLLDNNYVFNAPKGNLTSRQNLSSLPESFQYDNLDRLTHYTNALGEQEQQIYNPNGKISSNTLGTYGYDSTKTYQQNILEMTELGKAYYQSREGLFDGTMEDKSGWSLTTLSSYASDKVKSGKYSLKVNLGTGQALPVTIQSNKKIPIDNTATTKYTISGWVFNANTNSQSSLKLNMTTSGGTTTTTSSATNSAINSWVYLSQEIDVPATIKQLSISIGADGTGAIWYDDLKIRKTADITAERKLNITYNMFKAPVTIEETGVDKISFEYINSYESRSSMYYGSMNNDKMLRPYRKHYSADGTTEIKHNIVDNSIEFITYIGGDGYDAPVVFKKKGAVQEYLYLHRDYQGSIVAISNQAGTVLEKRAFDAWGNILNVQGTAGVALNGLTILDRGYTGHEHLQSVALINMNGRIYDPKLHRFLQPDNDIQDPYNTQNFNRYGYVLNNPLRYTDPSGENFLTWMSGGNCTTCGSEYGGGGGIDGLGSLFIGLGITAEKNWPTIKDFFTKNNFENPFKQTGKWIEKQAGGINDWLDKQLRSIGHSKKDYQKIVVSPQYGAAQSSGGWIKTGFQNVGLTGSVNNSGGGDPDPRPRFNLANFFKSLFNWGRNPEEAERNNENRRIFNQAADRTIEYGTEAHLLGVDIATAPFGGVGKVQGAKLVVSKIGTEFSKHSLLRLAERGVSKDMAKLVLRKGQKFYDPLNKSVNYVLPNGFASGKSLLVGTNPFTGEVTTVIRSSKNLINKRFIPIK